jgi:transposase-like protein
VLQEVGRATPPVDQALYAVIMEAYINGVSTLKVGALVAALASQSGISKSQVSHICQVIDKQVQAFLCRPLQESGYAYVYIQENAGDILSRWDDLAVSLADRFPKAAELMNEAREDVLAFRHFPLQHQ